jgi:hypothetical protein
MMTDEAIDARIKYMDTPKPKEILRRGKVSVITWDKQLSKLSGDAPRRRSVKVRMAADLLEHGEWLQAADPTHGGVTTISLRENKYHEDWEAYSTPNGSWMVMDVDWLTMYRATSGHKSYMPTYYQYPNSIFTMTHEYGHMRDDRTEEQRTADDGMVAGLPGMSEYGKTSDYEGYAEAYAEWILSYGETTNEVALYFARKYNWPVPKETSKWRS